MNISSFFFNKKSEVKRHLAEFVLKKKNKEAGVGSMTNLKMSTATHTAPSTPPHAHLRKTASESNLVYEKILFLIHLCKNKLKSH